MREKNGDAARVDLVGGGEGENAEPIFGNEADESDLPDDQADLLLREAVEDLDAAAKNLWARVKEKNPQVTRPQYGGALFKWLQAHGVGDLAKSTVEQRVELMKEIDAGTFPPPAA